MVFLSPAFLFGLFALSVPIIIHLFNFRRTRKVYFTNTRFLRNVKEVSTTKLKLKHWLILASRLLFILFLVLAFAQPFIPADENAGDVQNVVVYLDNSYSMSNEVDIDQTAFESGINFIYSILDLFPPDTKYKLITNDFAPYSNTLKSRDEILELTTTVKMSGVSRSAEEIARRITSDPDLGSMNQVFWISDFQKSSTGDFSMISSDSANRYNLVPINFTSTSNVYVDSVFLDNIFVMSDERVVLNVKVWNKGNVAKEDVLLKVFINDVQVGSTSVSLDQFASETLKFELGSSLENINKCRVSIEEYPVTFDNEFYLTLNFQDRIKVTEIKTGNDQTVVERVYGNNKVFLFESYTADDLDLTALVNSDLIILNALDDIRLSLRTVLDEFVEEGGSLALIPGDQPDVGVLGSFVRGRTLRLQDTTQHVGLAMVDANNPFFSNVFESTEDNMIMPEATSVIVWGNDRDAILKYKNGQPFLSIIANDEGNVYLFSSPLEDAYTNFHRNALFVPVMYKMAARSVRSSEQLYYYLGDELLNVKLDSVRRDNILRIAGNGLEIVPSQRSIGDRVLLELPRYSIEAGIYDLFDEDARIASLAFNIDRSESDLEQYTRQELDDEFQLSENINIFSAGNVEQFSSELTASFAGIHLWKYAIVLALLFLLTEILLIRFL
jgi:hypothetical protein